MKEHSEIMLRTLLDREQNKFNVENWNSLLTEMIEKDAKNHCGPRVYDSIGRFEALKKICCVLNDLQSEMVFSNNYKVEIRIVEV